MGELNFGDGAVSHVDQLQIDWFDFWLKGIDNGISDRAPVKLFLMGKNQWLDLPEFPSSPIMQNLYLSANKQLQPQPPISNSQLPDIYVYDPRNPNPATAYGFYDQRQVHQRWDVLIYQSEILSEELAIAGIPKFILYAAS